MKTGEKPLKQGRHKRRHGQTGWSGAQPLHAGEPFPVLKCSSLINHQLILMSRRNTADGSKTPGMALPLRVESLCDSLSQQVYINILHRDPWFLFDNPQTLLIRTLYPQSLSVSGSWFLFKVRELGIRYMVVTGHPTLPTPSHSKWTPSCPESLPQALVLRSL